MKEAIYLILFLLHVLTKKVILFNRVWGRTLNITEAGILLETHVDIEPEQIFFITIGFDDDTLELKGKVAYCNKSKEKKFAVGIHFLETGKADILILKQYIKLFENK